MLADTWKALCSELAGSMEPEEFQLWIKPLHPAQDNGPGLSLACPNAFHRNWVREHYLDLMQRLLTNIKPSTLLSLDLASPPTGDSRPRQLSLPKVDDFAPLFNQRFIFDNFVTGACNEFAWAASKSLARGKQTYTNTLFLFSTTGLGKTHLTQAVGQAVLCGDPGTRVAYLTAEDFANQMIAALKRKRIEQFKDRFRRGCDLLLLEEVQFLSGKDKTQDELCYTLDALADAGKRIVFTGATPPTGLKGLKDGMASRLNAAVPVPIEPPDPETRRRILARTCQEEKVPVPEEVLDYLAQELSGDVRRLQSALRGVIARVSLTGRPADLTLAGEVVGQMATRPRRATPQRILTVVSQVYGLEPAILCGKSRIKSVTRPRNLAMFLCRRHTDASYAAIGRTFGRDHSTVMYGVTQVERGLKRDGKLNQELAFLEQRLGLG